jgi:CrcB protein
MKDWHWLLVFAGSGTGGVMRFFISRSLLPLSHFPFGTLAVNVLACLVAGFLFGLPQVSQIQNPSWKLLLLTGFCGGFSTFSAFGLDFLMLQQKGMGSLSFLYLGLSVILSLIAIWAGYRIQQIL